MLCGLDDGCFLRKVRATITTALLAYAAGHDSAVNKNLPSSS